MQVENDTILKLAGLRPYTPATERRATPLVEATAAELQSLLAAHNVAKAQQLAEHARLLALHSAHAAHLQRETKAKPEA